MSERRAKQKRRLIAMSMSGDQAATTTLHSMGVTEGEYGRAAMRDMARSARRRVGLLANPAPGSWDPAREANARAKLRRSFKRMLEL
jgi:hypothetical protein